jgi:hypothetical protein
MIRCIRLCLNCADVCTATAEVTSRPAAHDADVTEPLLEACVAICKSCGDECERHARMHKHCRVRAGPAGAASRPAAFLRLCELAHPARPAGGRVGVVAELLCHSLAAAAAEKSGFMLADSRLPRRVDGQVDGAPVNDDCAGIWPSRSGDHANSGTGGCASAGVDSRDLLVDSRRIADCAMSRRAGSQRPVARGDAELGGHLLSAGMPSQARAPDWRAAHPTRCS